MKKAIISFLFLLILTGRAAAEETLGLFDCYRLALKQSEEIQIHEERIKEAEARFQRAHSSILPRASLIAKEIREEEGGASAFKAAPERKLNFSQPLFRGFKEFSAMASTKALTQSRIYEKRWAEQLLFLDVSDAFYQILELRHDSEILLKMQRTGKEEVRELAHWIRIGRARSSEMALAKTQLKRLSVQSARTHRLLAVSHEVLALLTGVSDFHISDERLEWTSKAALSEFLNAIGARSDLLAKERGSEAAKAEIKIEKADLFPTASLDGNWFQERPGAKTNVDWDLLLTITLPVFERTQVSDVLESQSLYRQAILDQQRTKRQIESEIRRRYEEFRHLLDEGRALREALISAQKTYELKKGDYQFRLLAYLELLTSLMEVQEIEQELNHVEFQTKRAFWNLKVAAGELNAS